MVLQLHYKVGVSLLVIYIPPLQTVFQKEVLTSHDLVCIVTLPPALIDEVRKLVESIVLYTSDYISKSTTSASHSPYLDQLLGYSCEVIYWKASEECLLIYITK